MQGFKSIQQNPKLSSKTYMESDNDWRDMLEALLLHSAPILNQQP